MEERRGEEKKRKLKNDWDLKDKNTKIEDGDVLDKQFPHVLESKQYTSLGTQC